ncbi:uncharacterized protein [Bemisia tabaci]|uniref:uncharacterized protein n=1 Tax=Bemisia tabaci TaxID=7038 RepID=UPI003B27FD68
MEASGLAASTPKATFSPARRTLPTSSGRSETGNEQGKRNPTRGGSETESGKFGSKRPASSPLSEDTRRSSPVDVSLLKQNLNESWREDHRREPLRAPTKAPAACGAPQGLTPLPSFKASPCRKTIPPYTAPPGYNPQPGIKPTTVDRGTHVFRVSAPAQSSTSSFVKPTTADKEAVADGKIGAVTTQRYLFQ